jgi:LytS/YehU family sensor histidine kinase
MGPFDYGRMDYRLLMEYHKQLIVFWFIFGMVFFIRYVQKNQEEKLRAARLEEALTKARLQALQMQLHPHFLFNTLNMISSIMYENVKAADKMIASLSDLLRITLKSTNRGTYTLEKELELLNLYIEIMKARFRDNLVIHMDINSESRHALVPGFILQPLVENSIRHSMDHLKTTEIQISSRKKNERLILMVEDNGPGISGDAQQMIEKGVGLSNIVERFEELYGTDYSFQMQNINDGGLQVVIDIPFQSCSKEQCG